MTKNTTFIEEGRYARICPACGGRFEETKARGGAIDIRRCSGCPALSQAEQMARTSESKTRRDRERRAETRAQGLRL